MYVTIQPTVIRQKNTEPIYRFDKIVAEVSEMDDNKSETTSECPQRDIDSTTVNQHAPEDDYTPPRRDTRSCLFGLIGFVLVSIGAFNFIALIIGAFFTIMAFNLGVTALKLKEYGRTGWAMGGRVASFFALWMLVAILLHGDFSHEMIEPQLRTKTARVRADLRAHGIALEEYFKENREYPHWSTNPAKNNFGIAGEKDKSLSRQPTFATWSPNGPPTLTTPIGYLSPYFWDPFSPGKASYSYYCHNDVSDTSHSGWIIWSPGPDRVYDLTIANIAQAYDPNQPVPSALLLSLTYDTTNGTVSRGDVYRYKQ